MERFEHGGDVYRHPGAIDFSASLNPLGMPSTVREELCAQVDAFARYPDPTSRELTEAIAAFEQVDGGRVLACAGATDALSRICQVLRPQRSLVCAPCYVGYEQALAQAGISVEHHDLDAADDFAPTLAFVEGIRPGIGLVFLANPNNPTGRCLDRTVLQSCLRRAHEVGATVVLDECFIDLTQEAGSNDLLDAYHNLVIVKAFTKTFALAGLRLGYVLSADEGLLYRLAAVGLPWAVSVPAQIAGVACVRGSAPRDEGDGSVRSIARGDGVVRTGARGADSLAPSAPPSPAQAYLDQSRRLIASERVRMSGVLRELGCRVVPSQANYLLFRAQPGLAGPLLERGLLVRACDNFRGLDERWYRVAVRMPEDNDLLLAALEEVLAPWHDHS